MYAGDPERLMAGAVVPKPPQAHVAVNPELCKGCDVCVVVCPQQNLELSDRFNRMGYHPVEFRYHGKKGACTACGLCYWVCPDFAIVKVERRRR